MDRVVDSIVNFTSRLEPGLLREEDTVEAQRRLVDSLGCMLGGGWSEPARIARALAGDVEGRFAASVLGMPGSTTVEAAVFANTVMVRYLDFNDTYFGPRGGGGHPSDLVPTALAVAEACGASGPETALLLVLGYEVMSRLQSTVKLRERGWDQGFYTGLAAAVMTGKAVGLDNAQLGNAVSLAVVPHVPLRVTRAGELSMWKGCATADAAASGVRAARMAQRGMTGPALPFEGEDGVFERVSGPFGFELSVRPDHYVLTQVHTKYRPAEYNAQAVLDLAVELRAELDLADVRSIHVQTYWLGYSEIGCEPEKWDPRTRETADHSLPFLLARALVDGDIDFGSFTPEKVLDPALRPLMNTITVAENADHTRRFPAELMVTVAVELRDGRRIERAAAHPKGHVRNRLTDAELDHKFAKLVAPLPDADRVLALEARAAVRKLEALDDMGSVLRNLRGLQGVGR